MFCDPTVRSRDNAQAPDIILQGLTAGSERAKRLQKYFHDGSWAERIRVPTECVVRIGPLSDTEAVSWCAFGNFVVPYGGYVAANLQPGEIVLVNGATGAFGSGGVAVALAMGASSVIATGRNQQALDDLARRFGERVRPVRMVVDEERDRKAILDAAPAPIDCVLDLLPPAATPAQVRAALLTVRPYGRVVLMGGIGPDVAVPYSWLMRNCVTIRGQWMYSREVDCPADRAGPCGPAVARPPRGQVLQPGRRERGDRPRRRQCRPVPHDGAAALSYSAAIASGG